MLVGGRIPLQMNFNMWIARKIRKLPIFERFVSQIQFKSKVVTNRFYLHEKKIIKTN